VRKLGSFFSVLNSGEVFLVRALAFLWFAAGLCVFLFFPPYWALMDDWGHIQSAAAGFEGQNLWPYVSGFVKADFGWGMFRPFYAIFIYLFYGTFWQSSRLAYLVLYLLNVLLFFAWAVLFERCLIRFAGAKRAKTGPFAFYRWLFFIFCFLFSPNFTLFFFASLQERLVLLFGALAFSGMVGFAAHTEQSRFPWAAFVLILLGVLCAAMSKATAIFFLPAFAGWSLVRFWDTKKPRFLILAGILIFLAAGFAFYFYSIRGGYTSGYQTVGLWNRFLRAGRRFFTPFWSAWLTILALLVDSFFVERKFKAARSFFLLIWPLLLLCALLVMLPWRSIVNYYLIVPAGMFWTGSKVILCYLLAETVRRIWPKAPVLLILVLISAGVSVTAGKKFWNNAKQHHVTQDAVTFLKNELKNWPDDALYVRMPMPCIEASDAVSAFLGRPGLIRIFAEDGSLESAVNERKRVLLVTNGECSDLLPEFTPAKEIFHRDPWKVYEKARSSGVTRWSTSSA